MKQTPKRAGDHRLVVSVDWTHWTLLHSIHGNKNQCSAPGEAGCLQSVRQFRCLLGK